MKSSGLLCLAFVLFLSCRDVAGIDQRSSVLTTVFTIQENRTEDEEVGRLAPQNSGGAEFRFVGLWCLNQHIFSCCMYISEAMHSRSSIAWSLVRAKAADCLQFVRFIIEPFSVQLAGKMPRVPREFGAG